MTGFSPNNYTCVRATRPELAATAAERTAYLKESRRYEWILVGTKKGNARFVLVNRGISPLSP